MAQHEILQVPVTDRAWLMAGLNDALAGKGTLLPIATGITAAEALSPSASIPPQTAVIVHTSGSSGVPKNVALSASALHASAAATNERLGGAGQWLVALPTNLISGLQMLTRSILAGTAPIFYDGKFKPADFIKRAIALEESRRYTSVVPVQLAALIEHAETEPRALKVMQRFDAILVGGQATPLGLRQRAHEAGINLVRTYGMTETAGGAVYDGVEIGDTQVRVRDGEVQLAGSSLALGYVGDEELTRQRFTIEDGVRWFRTGDSGALLGGMLEITGRIDRAIVSGGTNVSLDEVEKIVHEFADVHGINGLSSSVATEISSEKWGSSVGLLSAGDQLPESDFVALQDALSKRLGAAARIAKIFYVAEIPRLAGGKPDLKAVTALTAGAPNGQ